MPQKILTVKNLNVVLSGQEIIKNLDLEIEEGESLAIIGPNGSGKTVLLKCLLGILPYQGEIRWSPNVKLGYVPQKVDVDLHLPITLENLLEAKAEIMKIPKEEIKSVTEIVNLSEKILKTPVGHLSGGQFQKALICFALLGKPSVLIFDEPTASLDQLTEEHIYDLIRDLQEKYKITIILVSHDLNILYRQASTVLCLNKEKVCYGQPHEALTPEVLAKLYNSPMQFYQHQHHQK